MKAYPVSKAVNSPHNNSKDLLKEIEIQHKGFPLNLILNANCELFVVVGKQTYSSISEHTFA
jgi:hypothetical protein